MVTLAAGGLAFAGAAGAAPPAAPANPHEVTCASPRIAKEYQEGLAEFYQGKLDDAVRTFQDVIKRDPRCAMAEWGLSRTFQKQGKSAEASAEAGKAEALAGGVDDRESRLIGAWAKYLKALAAAEKERESALNGVRRDLDTTIALYPDDPEVWLFRGVVAESPLRAIAYNLAALRIQPGHPFGKTFTVQAPPAPTVEAKATQPVPLITPAPKLYEGLGNCSLPITTSNPLAQQYFDQGLRCLHSYVLPGRENNGAAAFFQQAAALDPEAPMPYWGLSFCPPGPISNLDAANRAVELAQKKGTEKEKRFAAVRLLELSGRDQKTAFFEALDGAIAAFPDEVEFWIWRGKAFGGNYGSAGGNVAAMPYQLAAYRMRPEHPSPSHELVHLYEAIDRPALGWPFTVNYRQSAYNMPHANHMQAHLATRLGRWQEAIDCTRTSRRKSLEGFPELDPSHHIDIMIRALAHEGRFKEADAEPKAYRNGLPWARLLQLKAVTSELDAWAEARRASNATDGFYIGAIAKLDAGEPETAVPFIENVEQQFKKSSAPLNMYRFNEVRGRYLVQTGHPDEGLQLLRDAAAKAVKDTGLHAWGGGSYMLEVWGEAALRAHRWDEAEEAFHEALAHEHGSVIGALGMQVVWEQRSRPEMVAHYARRAAEIWKDADPGCLDRQRARLQKLAAGSATTASARTGE